VVTHLTVDVQPTFNVAQYVYQGASLDELIEKHEDVFASGYSVSSFTDWARERCDIWLKLRASSDGEFVSPQRDWLGGTLATEAMHPVPGMPAETCTEQLGVPGPWFERLPHFRPEFTPSRGDELQSEFFVPRARAAEAFEAMQRLGDRISPVVLTSEIRTIAADELWLSPAYQRDCFALHFTWLPDRAAVTPVLAAIEDALLPLDARPHWGKFFVSGPQAALATYPRVEDFRRLLERRDPRGKFRNEFINALF
jgi:xylitol oxidase